MKQIWRIEYENLKDKNTTDVLVTASDVFQATAQIPRSHKIVKVEFLGILWRADTLYSTLASAAEQHNGA